MLGENIINILTLMVLKNNGIIDRVFVCGVLFITFH